MSPITPHPGHENTRREARAFLSAETAPPQSADYILNWEAGLSVVDGDEDLYRELLVIFRDSVPVQLENMREALALGDIVAVEREAHSLKGAAANIGARAVSETARHLEYAAKQRDFGAAHGFSDQLRSAFKTLLTLLDASADARGQ